VRLLPTSACLHFAGNPGDRVGVESRTRGWKEVPFLFFDVRAVCTHQGVGERFDFAARAFILRIEIADDLLEPRVERFVLAMLACEALEHRRELGARGEARKQRLLLVLFVPPNRTIEETRNLTHELDIDLRSGRRTHEIVEALFEPSV
jgi:hypothetical protein